MLQVLKKQRKALLYLAAITLIFGLGISSYAQLSSDAYTVRTAHIFPAQIQADGWHNAETLTFQNLDQYSLLQDFNKINSATLGSVKGLTFDEIELVPSEPISDEVQSADVVASTTIEVDLVATTTASNSDVLAEELVVATTTASVTPEQSAPVEELVPDDSAEQVEGAQVADQEPVDSAETEVVEEVSESPKDESATTTVLREVRSLFHLAIESITETFSSSSPEGADSTEVEVSEVAPETAPVEAVSFGFVDSSNNTETLEVSEETFDTSAQSSSSEVLADVVIEVESTSTADVAAVVPSAPETPEVIPLITEDVATPVDSADPAAANVELEESTACTVDCDGHVLRLSNFGFPLEEGVEISGAQLRMSFAAKHKATREEIPSFIMNYSFDGGDSWSTGGSVIIDDEVSNSINGGYYLFALPNIADPSDLTNLQVELRYDADPELVDALYVDSVWLELFILEPTENIETTSFAELLENDGYVDSKLSGDTLILPNGESLDFTFTDNNDDETLIVKSDKKTYAGLSETTTYFSVTNISDQSDDFTVQTYFPREVGEVTSLDVFNINKPRQAILPEYRPYVYHCEAGWETKQIPSVPVDSLESLSIAVAAIATTSSSTQALPLVDTPSDRLSTTTGVITAEATTTAVVSVASEQATELASYSCRQTSVIKSCDAIDGEGTACVVNQKVQDHQVTMYAPGWDEVAVLPGAIGRGGFFKRVGSFFGFGPKRKDVPEEFEGENFSDESFTIAPGETRYFKMDITFPPFTSGEYWIEVIGDNEYGLLDPFWSSQWQYRLPISIDNTASAQTLTEQQVFLELDSSLTDFWSNVNDNGSDIRFAQKTVAGNEEEWYGTGWAQRRPITIQAAQVDAPLTDFPVYVDLGDLGSSFFNAVLADGADIRVTEADGVTEVPHELVAVNTGGETGELHFKAGSISDTVNTTFYIYHDNPNVTGYSATDTYGAENVWGSNFIAVYHMEEAAAGRGTADLYQDSTNNDYDADDELNSAGKTGQLGQGQEIDAQGDASEYLLMPSDIVNGETQLTFSYWVNSSEGNSQALINGGASSDYLVSLTGGGTTVQFSPGGTAGVTDISNSTWRHVTVSRDAGANLWEIFVDGQSQGTNSTSLNTLSIPADCLVVGLEQDTSCLNSSDTSLHINAFIDEMRFYNTVPTDDEISATYRNQATTTDFYNVGAANSLTVTSFSELDHWVQHFSTTTDEADIWVQVDTMAAGASTTIYLYYGKSGAVSTSDEYAPFTYNTSNELYYVTSDLQTSPIVVYSYIDGNEVSIDGGTAVTLNSGETTSFATYSSSSVISAMGPITARTSDALSEPPVPISFATTTNLVTTNRTNETFYVHAPFTDASVGIFEGASGAATSSGTVVSGSTRSFSVDITGANSGILESDEPVLLFHSGANDSYVAYPPVTRPIFGVYSSNFNYTAIGSTDVAVYCSSGTNGTTTMSRGIEESNDFCSGAANGLGNGVMLINAASPIAATQEADGDGGESSRFLPTPEFGTRYILPQATEYVTAVCSPRFGTVNIEVQDVSGGTIDSGTCTPSNTHPGVLNITPGTAYTQGFQVVSTNNKPFYMYYEENANNDETNTWSAVQARAFESLDVKPFTYGAQELNIDAEYEQYSYAWYENTNSETPVDPWSLGDDGDVVEGQVIDGQGAINSGDTLRLRMSLLANVATGSVESTAFALEYAVAQTCSTASGWQEIGKVGSTTAAFSGLNNAAVNDGQTLTSTLLASSTVFGTYEEASLSAFNPVEIGPGAVAEWDWVLINSNAQVNTEYCFRMVRSSGDELVTYTTFPQLLTSGPPEVAVLLKRFDNEHANSIRPTLEFVAGDLSGDELQYQIQIDDDVAFGSTVVNQNTISNAPQFLNIAVPGDKTPFTSGQVIRYTPPSNLVSSTTYWWRVRSIDTAGSNTYSAWSAPFNFTINESLVVSEWYQTTDEQFETNTLTTAITSGSGSIVPDTGGSSLIGEYGSVSLTNGATSTVSLNNSYTNPVVVGSLRYPRNITSPNQPAARVFNKGATSFDVKADNFSNDSNGSSTFDYIVMEAGEYLMDDNGNGVRVFATSTAVAAIAGSSIPTDPGGLDIAFPTTFSPVPSVFTMVTTNNDPQWVVSSVYDGNDVGNPPTASQVSLYLNDNLDSNGHGSVEDIDVIAFDVSSGENNGVSFTMQNTAADVTDTPNTKTFSPTFGGVPGVILTQQLTMNGAQGGYSQIDINTAPTASNVTISIEEGGSGADRGHAAESVAIIAFEGSGGNLVRVGNATVVSPAIDFDDADVGNVWGEVSFNDAGIITYQVQYLTGGGFQNIPDSALPGNETGFTSSPINISNLDTDTYNELRIVAQFGGVDPEIFDWTVTWGLQVSVPQLGGPFDNEKVATTTPTFDFSTTDPQGDVLEYEISFGFDRNFVSSTTINSTDSPAHFSGTFDSGDTITFTIPGGLAFTNTETYWWRVRAKDPAGGDAFSPWSDPNSFTVETAITVSTWFQTTIDQFFEGELNGVTASTSNSIEITPDIGEYGTTSVTNNAWTTITTSLSYNNMVVVASPEYAFNGSDNGRTVQVRNKTSNSFEIKADNYTESLSGVTAVDYIVMEAGDWVIVDGGSGTRIVAGTVADVSSVEGSIPGYSGGTLVDFNPDFGSVPGALTTVSTANGSKWVATVIDDGTTAGEITAASMYVALGIGLDTDTVRVPEDIDYIAFEESDGTNNGVLFDAFNTTQVVTESETESTISFNQTFSSAPGVIVVQNNGTDGTDGGFAQVDTDTAITATEVDLTIAEIGSGAGNHAAEVVSLLAFEAQSGTIRRESSASSGLSGTIASEEIFFSAGTGPRFAQVLFATTSPGTSSTSVQVQYQTGPDTWALIPNGQISGNSIGSTVSPIDLTGIDVATYPVVRLFATLYCDTTNCPTLADWTVEWAEGVPISGTIKAYDRTTDVTSGTVQVAINGVPGNTGTIAGDGTWIINNVTAFDGDIVTIWVDGAAEANEATNVFVYDGAGDMEDVDLYEQHLTFSSNKKATTTNIALAAYDFSVSGDEDIFFDVDINNDLTVCAQGTCPNANIFVGTGHTYIPDTTGSGNVVAHDLINNGHIELDANTARFSGSWDNNSVISIDTSMVIFTATSGTETIDDPATVAAFYNVTFGETAGVATWDIIDATLDVNQALRVNQGTLDRSTTAVTVAGLLATGANGFWSGSGTTTFDGVGSVTWADTNLTLQDIGYVVVDGDSKVVVMNSSVRASNIIIGINDTLNGGGAWTLDLSGNFTNTGTFLPQTSTIAISGTATNAFITTGASNLYNLTASSSGGSVSFVNTSVTLLGDLTIATGTVTAATVTTIINGSLTNVDGAFVHNNGLVQFTSSVAETIQLQGTVFLNHFYDVSFTGSGIWIFVDTNATTSNDVRITGGTLMTPSGNLAIGGSLLNTNGSIAASAGVVKMYSGIAESITLNGSSLYSLLVDGAGTFTITDTNAEVSGDLTVSTSTLVLPSGIFSLGGSLLNNATITPQTGTVLFNSIDTGETIDLGSSSLYNVNFDAAGGGWTITQNATTTNNFTLATSSEFTLASGQVLSVGGAFTNNAGGASTTWSGSTLLLDNASKYEINVKTTPTEQYENLIIGNNSDISSWNSAATSTVVAADSSLYSKDNAGVDGHLFIFGDYRISTTTEYWSYATDFDGVVLGLPRKVYVSVSDGSAVSLDGGTLYMIGEE
jgi:hypothetical protein